MDKRLIEFSDSLSAMNKTLAAPFLGHIPEQFPRGQGILYVGKATDKDFGLKRYQSLRKRGATMIVRIEERLQLSRDIFQKGADRPFSMFWHFAHQISRKIDPKCTGLSNIAWSNLRRIGSISGNPNHDLSPEEHQLYVTLLKEEIRDLRPSVVVFVTSQYGENILNNVLVQGAKWKKSENDRPLKIPDVWWLEPHNVQPAFVWMRHPQGAKKAVLEYASDRIAKLSRYAR